MGEEGNLFGGDVAVSTPYGVVYIRNQGREVTFQIHDSISQNEHNKRLFNYVQYLYEHGAERINCDHVKFDFLDRGQNLRRGRRILDIVYEKNGRLYECELKTKREIWLDTTAYQLKDMLKACENLIVLVPRAEIEQTVHLFKTLKFINIKVDTYEV